MTKKSTSRKRAARARLRGSISVILFLVLFAGIGVKFLFFSYAATTTSEHIIATLYAYPTLSSWSQVENASPTVNDAIVNVCAPDGSGSGCNGKPADAITPAWTPTISTLKSKGILPLYYISTNYGATALGTLEAELKQANTWYGTPSPMFDTMEPSGTCSNGGSSMSCVTYNQDLYNYAVSIGASAVVYNPGTTFGVSTADMFGSKEIIQVFEGTAADFEKTSFPSWMSGYSPSQFVVTLSSGTAATIGTDVNDAVKNHIGNLYEDDEAEPPNYSTLPSYWSAEIKDVAAVSSGTSTPPPSNPPSPTPTPTPTPTPKPTPTPTPSPAPVTGTPGGGSKTPPVISLPPSVTTPTTSPTAQTGTVTLGTLDKSAQITVDGTKVSNSGTLNTSTLTNGKHVVTVTQNGNSVQKTIYVHNKLTPYETMRNFLFAKFVRHPQTMNLAAIGLLLLPFIVIALFLRHRLFSKYRQIHHPITYKK